MSTEQIVLEVYAQPDDSEDDEADCLDDERDEETVDPEAQEPHDA